MQNYKLSRQAGTQEIEITEAMRIAGASVIEKLYPEWRGDPRFLAGEVFRAMRSAGVAKSHLRRLVASLRDKANPARD
jgi:hypothetical protein